MTDASREFLKSLELSFNLKEEFENLKSRCAMFGVTLPEIAMSLLAEKIVRDSVANNWLPITIVVPENKAKTKLKNPGGGFVYMSPFSVMQQDHPFNISFVDLDQLTVQPEKYMSDRIVYQVFSRNECELLINIEQKKHIKALLIGIVSVLKQEKSTQNARDFKNNMTNIIKKEWK